MATVVAWSGIVAAAVCMMMGIWSAVQLRPKRRELVASITPPMSPSPEEPPGPITNHSLSTAMDGVAKVASALKDLDRVAQMFTLALGFLAVAAVAAGVEVVAATAS